MLSPAPPSRSSWLSPGHGALGEVAPVGGYLFVVLLDQGGLSTGIWKSLSAGTWCPCPRTRDLPVGGQLIHRWCSGHGHHSCAGGGFGQSQLSAFGQDNGGMGAGTCRRRRSPEPWGRSSRTGRVKIRGHGHGTALLRGIYDAVERFTVGLTGGQFACGVYRVEVGAGDALHGPDDGSGDDSVADRRGQGLQSLQVTLIPASMTAWAMASTKWVLPVLLGPAIDRFSARCTHSRVASPDWVAGWDGGFGLPSGAEPLAGGQAGGLASGTAGGVIATADLLDHQHPQHFGGVPALRFRGGQDLGGARAQLGQPRPVPQRGELNGQRRRGRLPHGQGTPPVVVNPAQPAVPGRRA